MASEFGMRVGYALPIAARPDVMAAISAGAELLRNDLDLRMVGHESHRAGGGLDSDVDAVGLDRE